MSGIVCVHCIGSILRFPLYYLQTTAKGRGLWNLFLPIETDKEGYGAGLTNLEYSHLAEIMGWSLFGSEVCSTAFLVHIIFTVVT